MLPRVGQDIRFARKAEAALTLAVLQYALAGIGVAWLPRSMIAAGLAAGQLVGLEDRLPVQALDIRMIRLSGTAMPGRDAAWARVCADYGI